MKGITFNLSLCSPDPEAAALLAGGKVICEPGTSEIVGYSSPKVGDIVGNPVAVEIWSKAIVGGKPAAGTPYWHWVFPYVRVRYDGDREFSNGALANEFSGTGVGNESLVAAGLDSRFPPADFVKYRQALENPFSYVRTATKPDEGWSGSFMPTAANSIGCATGAAVVFDQAPFVAVGATEAGLLAATLQPGGGVFVPPPPPTVTATEASVQAALTDEVSVDVPAGTTGAALMALIGQAIGAAQNPQITTAAAIKTYLENNDAHILVHFTGDTVGMVFKYDHTERHISVPPGGGPGSTPDPQALVKNPFAVDTTVGDGGYFVAA
jgi:hypothetical protein